MFKVEFPDFVYFRKIRFASGIFFFGQTIANAASVLKAEAAIDSMIKPS